MDASSDGARQSAALKKTRRGRRHGVVRPADAGRPQRV